MRVVGENCKDNINESGIAGNIFKGKDCTSWCCHQFIV